MNFFRRTSKRVLLLWSLLLSLSLLFSQEVVLHAHHLDHGEDTHLDHSHASDETSQHGHFSEIHAIHITHDEHHEGIAYEIDACPDRVINSISDMVFVFALFVFAFSLVFTAPLQQIVQRRRKNRPILYEHHFLSPLTRAPPF